jgi:Na+/H+ antiporter NhaD/arsenite permease-like protein
MQAASNATGFAATGSLANESLATGLLAPASWRMPARRALGFAALASLLLILNTIPAFAADIGLDGKHLSPLWGLPFVGILLCIATGPILFPHVWEHHYGKITSALAICVVLPLYYSFEASAVTATLAHAMLLEYLPFILLLLALFTTAGGIYLEGNLHDGIWTNTLLLGIGTILASIIGTTGASMILIRPLLRVNDDRRYNVHVVVFFIFLVSNVGGALTPLGDPPLFIGFLKGVDFFWTTTHLLTETLFVGGALLVIFFFLDLYFHRLDAKEKPVRDPTPDSPVRLHGKINFILIAIIIAAILMSASWNPGITFKIAGNELALQNLLRDAIFVLVVFASLILTKKGDRTANGFTWGPIEEVAILFAGIFLCIAPVTAMLHAGMNGPFAPLIQMVTLPNGAANPVAYFWMTGILSSFLDNAPTYLVFFELAGGDPKVLMTTGAATLAAISSGAVYMGANTYIGNAPNFMVYAIARRYGVKMPSFFGYMGWSAVFLLPLFAIATWIFFMPH